MGVRYTTEAVAAHVDGRLEHRRSCGRCPTSAASRSRSSRARRRASWPPGPGEIVLEKSVLQVEQFAIGETITVETDDKTRARAACRRLRARHQRRADASSRTWSSATCRWARSTCSRSREKYNYLALSLDPALSQAAASRIAVDVRDRDLAAAGVQALAARPCPSRAATSSATSSRRSRCCCSRSACSRWRSRASWWSRPSRRSWRSRSGRSAS